MRLFILIIKKFETFKIFALWLILENWYVLVSSTFSLGVFNYYYRPKFRKKITEFDRSNIGFECNKDRDISIEIYLPPCTSDAENEPEETRVAPFPKGNGTVLSIVLTSRETSCFVSTARNIRKFKVSEWIYLRPIYCIEMYCGIAQFSSSITDRPQEISANSIAIVNNKNKKNLNGNKINSFKIINVIRINKKINFISEWFDILFIFQLQIKLLKYCYTS